MALAAALLVSPLRHSESIYRHVLRAPRRTNAVDWCPRMVCFLSFSRLGNDD